jgi:hypothetical protein
MRAFVALEETDPDKNMYFKRFSSELNLVQVIVGAESTVTRDEISNVLGDLT